MATVPNDIFLNGGDKYDNGMHKYGLDVLGAFDRKDYRFYMLNWARRHNKTTLAINILNKEAEKNPKSVYLYVAPTYKQGKNIIWDDPDMLFSYINRDRMKRISRQELMIEYPNESVLRIMGGDDPDKLRGINAKGIVLDEFPIFAHKKTIWQEIFLPILRKDHTRWAMFTFTPKGQDECFEMWNKAQDNPEWYTKELRASQSGLFPKAEYEKAKAETDPLLFSQEFECSFIAEEEMTFITSATIESLKLVNVIYPYKKKLVSVDPSLGGDECPILYMENYEIKHQVVGHWNDSKLIASEAFVIGTDNECKNYATDYIGLGEGVYSRLNDLKVNSIPVDVRNASPDPACYNLKAAMWWFVRNLMLNKKVPYPKDLKLRQQLCSVKFVFKNGLIACEDKTITKKRCGGSPDRAEAYVQGIYTMWHDIEPETIEDSYDFNVEEDYEYKEVACM